VLPEYFALTGRTIECSAEDEQQIREPVEILQPFPRDSFAVHQLHEIAFGSARHTACHMAQRCCTRSAGQDEFLERGQVGVVASDGCIQTG